MRNLTPEHMRCNDTLTCPSVHQRDDGMLVIVGRRAQIADVSEGSLPRYDMASEDVIVIDPALLDDWVKSTTKGFD